MEEQAQDISDIIAKWQNCPGALLPVLHDVQQLYGYIDATTVPSIAEGLNLSSADVFGVISFYPDFRQQPAGTQVIRICRAESCQATGGREIEALIKSQLELDYHQTTADGRFSLEPVYCFGNCACSPAIAVNQQLYGRLDSEEASIMIAKLLDGVAL